MTRSRFHLAAAALLGAVIAEPAAAGPPYVTDDPVPTETGHWEAFTFVEGGHLGGATEGGAGFDINYGAAKDVQLTLVLPVEYERDHGLHRGLGDVELAAKFLVLHQSEGAAVPDVALFPAISAPTGSNGFGSDKVGVFLPIWAQKDFGEWSLFGGGGYQINPGAGNDDFWQGGVALTRQLTERFSLGAEIYHRTREEIGGKAFTGLNIGAQYQLTDHWSLLASGGPGIQNRREGGDYAFYFSLKADY